MTDLAWAKGHGTENDFVILVDPDDELRLDADRVRALCDRRAGIGGDGLLRAVRDRERPERWFMDYRNADGSVAEMCGNGIRVFLAHLAHRGLVALAEGESVQVGTRGGTRTVRREGELLAVEMGPWRLDAGPQAAEVGGDRKVTVAGIAGPLLGLSVNVGNPHVVAALPDLDRLAAADLSLPPDVDPPAPEGINVELVVPGHGIARDGTAHGRGALAMRVHERGSGETRSCGTGAVAAALAARVWAGAGAPDSWVVQVPGGRLEVRLPAGSALAGDTAELVGPATIVAEGHLVADL
jgi:diaminopimelate epimerase